MFKRKSQKKMMEYQNQLMVNHYNEIENIYRQMRAFRHDYHNHIQTIKACIATGNISELEEYCNKLDTNLKTIDYIVKTGNIMLDAILNSKISLARHNDIDVNIKVNVNMKTTISDVDLCILIGNLLDNAMEACDMSHAKVTTEVDSPFIRIYIGTKGHQLYLCITNSVFTEVKKVNGSFLSNKESDSHGFGLERISKICSKYEGFCKLASEAGAFTTEILLPVLYH